MTCSCHPDPVDPVHEVAEETRRAATAWARAALLKAFADLQDGAGLSLTQRQRILAPFPETK